MKRFVLQCFAVTSSVLLVTLISASAMASAGWARTYRGENMDVLTPFSVVQTLDGGYTTAIFGMLRRVDDVGYKGHLTTSYELQILKTDQNGGEQWRRSYPTVEDPNLVTPTIYTYADEYVIVQTADQGYAVAGGSWMFKVDSQGSVLWTRAYTLDESSSNFYVHSMIQTQDGGFALTGTIQTYDGQNDYWLVKTNSLGIAQWNQTYNSGTYTDSGGNVIPRDDEAKCVIQTKDGGYALVGSASVFNSGTSSVTYSAWVVKTDAIGKQLWNRGYDLLNLPGYKSTIVQTSDAGYAVVGNQNNDFCLFKTSSSGQLQWSKTYGETQTDTPCSLVQLEDGGYAMAGTWTTIVPTMGLVRTDSSGKVLWTKTFNAKENMTSSSNDQANAMIRTRDGSYAIVGSTKSDNENHQDVFFVKTETLEQPLQTIPLPMPSENPEPSTNSTPGQTSQSSSNPNQSDQKPSQSPSGSGSSNETSSPNKLQILNQDQTLLIVGVILVVATVSVAAIITRKKRKKATVAAES